MWLVWLRRIDYLMEAGFRYRSGITTWTFGQGIRNAIGELGKAHLSQ